MAIDKARASTHLKAFDFTTLFIDELGWDRPVSRQAETVDAAGEQYTLNPVAEKRGVRIFHCAAIPERNTRQRIEREITKLTFEHLIIFTDPAQTKQIWQWVAREKGKPAAFREHTWLASSAPDALIQKLDHIAFALSEEEGLTLAGTTLRMRDAFDREKITKRFYEAFKQQHDQFLGFIEGLASATDRQWYASLMLNRLMFVYFIQKKRFLDGDIDYLKNRLEQVRAAKGADQFHSFYRVFLLKLFHGGLATAVDARDPDTAAMLGSIPYLNGGLFEPHALEADGNDIQIADAAFESVFNFFDQYEWTLDTRPIERVDGKEINPDVLGHIFEKYINQKQMGAYYTKEDITDYITKNTVVPWLFQSATGHDKVAFEPHGYVWRLLSENPDAYIYKSVRYGTETALPDNIAAGIDDVAQRTDWNKTAPREFGLPTEIWREVVARRERYETIRAKAAGGEITRIDNFITHNLDIRQFARDVIQYAESPDLVRAFWKGISAIKILDPACGSGAFLFAALNIQYDLYDACLERMEQFVASAPDSGGGRGQLYSDFRDVLRQIAQHPNRDYFIYKSIIISNLYGVDIMDEAVEICKLRLFLKLASQLESPDQIEPLPDIDFNIRAGNTLIGYTSIADVKKATEANGLDFDDRAGKIEAAAQDLDQAFRLFREQQTKLHGGIEVDHKSELRSRLTALESQLDRFLAKDYGVDVPEIGDDDLAASANFQIWKNSHKPFHWLIEFYGIINGGGFDVIVGNPPYIELSKVKADYIPRGYKTASGGNLYGLFVEHEHKIASANTYTGLIVPISVMCTKRTTDVQRQLLANSQVWASTFDVFPARAFEGAAQRVSIVIAANPSGIQPTLHTTRYLRWFQQERPSLIEGLEYAETSGLGKLGWLPRLGSSRETAILKRLTGKPLSVQTTRAGGTPIYAHRIVNNFVKAVKFPPYFKKADGTITTSDDFKILGLDKTMIDPFVAVLNSSLFYWYWRAHGDGFHCGYRDIGMFPFSLDKIVEPLRSEIDRLSDELNASLRDNSEIRTRNQKATGLIHLQTFFVGKSKDIIDQIDMVLTKIVGMSHEDTDFIINYDIKYRMGAHEDDPH
ncbi:Eco57I restriction-modification methylase domain-containing protein [Parasphingorhabdus flavimaris]|uniref:site-specific DNA-methyltransferase (adenine-specific) n=1 Tax=Parasphingorhabdus flavimaris TaxID=266812 RepID=A0ABX2MZX1_9SPHN|nr:DNA methyltransferase [Parasphingorhabdus flavimaris]NVD27001.1 Eco57I restriction-modification methylase domain-containing protein [Parasphingorhabdus flavimaris]